MTKQTTETNIVFLQQVVEAAKKDPGLAQRLIYLIRDQVFMPVDLSGSTANVAGEKLQTEILSPDEVVSQIFEELDDYFKQNPEATKILRTDEAKGLWQVLLQTTKEIRDGKKPNTIFLPLRGDKTRIGEVLPQNARLEAEVFPKVFEILKKLAANPDDIPPLIKIKTPGEAYNLRMRRQKGENILPHPVRKFDSQTGVLSLHPLYDHQAEPLPGIFDREDKILHEYRREETMRSWFNGDDSHRLSNPTIVSNMYRVKLGPWSSKFQGWEIYLVIDTKGAWWKYTVEGIELRQVK